MVLSQKSTLDVFDFKQMLWFFFQYSISLDGSKSFEAENILAVTLWFGAVEIVWDACEYCICFLFFFVRHFLFFCFFVFNIVDAECFAPPSATLRRVLQGDYSFKLFFINLFVVAITMRLYRPQKIQTVSR